MSHLTGGPRGGTEALEQQSRKQAGAPPQPPTAEEPPHPPPGDPEPRLLGGATPPSPPTMGRLGEDWRKKELWPRPLRRGSDQSPARAVSVYGSSPCHIERARALVVAVDVVFFPSPSPNLKSDGWWCLALPTVFAPKEGGGGGRALRKRL